MYKLTPVLPRFSFFALLLIVLALILGLTTSSLVARDGGGATPKNNKDKASQIEKERKAEEKEKKFLLEEEKAYKKINPKFSRQISTIFNNYPMYTNFSFTAENGAVSKSVNERLLDKLFVKLVFTGKVAQQYAKSPYIVTKKGDHFYTETKNKKAAGDIYILYKNTEQNRYVYLVDGYYDAFITLRGLMVVDARYVVSNNKAQFFLKSYVVATNSVLWRLARYLKSDPIFQKKIDKLYQQNIRYTIYLGKSTVYRIQDNLKKIDF